ncbi:hypothetical protein [Psychrobacter sp.]|uniref:hypothetical protein n=1 Tax=Psychrobacter sp. TaxID=56811 RepID=UPI003BB0B297
MEYNYSYTCGYNHDYILSGVNNSNGIINLTNVIDVIGYIIIDTAFIAADNEKYTI